MDIALGWACQRRVLFSISVNKDGITAEKILVVEDEPSLQETLAYNLKKAGYEVEALGDGRATKRGGVIGVGTDDHGCFHFASLSKLFA